MFDSISFQFIHFRIFSMSKNRSLLTGVSFPQWIVDIYTSLHILSLFLFLVLFLYLILFSVSVLSFLWDILCFLYYQTKESQNYTFRWLLIYFFSKIINTNLYSRRWGVFHQTSWITLWAKTSWGRASRSEWRGEAKKRSVDDRRLTEKAPPKDTTP